MQNQLPIEQIFWALPPGGKRNTRPAKLASALTELNAITPASTIFFHGRASSTATEKSLGPILPFRAQSRGTSAACFSPIYLRNLATRSFTWVDLYDDWSLAPDINLLNRMISSLSYKLLSKPKFRRQTLITCNTEYLAGKLQIPSRNVIPNGADRDLYKIKRGGDDRPRLVLLGHFFSGRTDFSLIEQISEAGIFEEVVIGAPGKSLEMKNLIEKIRSQNVSVIVHDWLDNNDIAKFSGRKTVALLPHLVNDYTVSQDLMKTYQLLSLGIPIIIPRLLLPHHISKKICFCWDFGVSTQNLAEWVDEVGNYDWDRSSFNEKHSWDSRASEINKMLSESYE